jgi:hypothetical protein
METIQPVTEEAVDGITYGTKGLFVDGIGLGVPPRDLHHDQNLIVRNHYCPSPKTLLTLLFDN